MQNKSILYIHLAEGSDNSLCDARKQSDESYYPEGILSGDEKRNGAIYCKGSIVLSGKGILKLTGQKKHGISVKSSFTLRPGATLAVNDVADNCIKAEGINILGGYIWAKTSADAGKCLSSDADVNIKGGMMKLYTSGGSIYEEDEKDTSSPAGIKADGNMMVSGGEMLCVSTGEGGKGLNIDGDLTIDSGIINIATSGGKYVYNAALDLDSSPKGIKADGKIIINGGRVLAFAENNDGIDSNGKLWVNGGLVITSGSGAPEEGFDCDFSQNFIVKGGILIGTGGAAIAPSSASTQRSVTYNGVSARTGEFFVITGPDGNPILRYKLPRTISRMAVFFSSEDIRSGETYTVWSGGSLSGNSVNWNGWFEDGTYTAGTELGTFTSNSLNTTVGQSGGPGGPGGPGGSGRPGGGPGW